MLGETRLVQGRAVPLVEFEAVAIFLGREVDHDAVTRDFGDNRRGGDRKGERIPINWSQLWQSQINDAGVDKQGFGFDIELQDGALHGDAVGRTETHTVKFIDRDDADADALGDHFNVRQELDPTLMR